MNTVNLFEHRARADRVAPLPVPVETPMSFIMRFIQSASLADCFTIAVCLSNRLFTLEKQETGMASANINEAAQFIADAAIDINGALVVEDEGSKLCAQCNGSGEGQHEGARCYVCKGHGTERREA